MNLRRTRWQRGVMCLTFAVLVGGCELFTDYDAIGRGIDSPEADSSTPDTGSTDTDGLDTEVVEDMTGDTSSDSGTDTDLSSDAGADADVANVEQCDPDEPSYVIRPASELFGEPAVDAACDEFSTIAPLPIPPANTVDSDPINSSDNDVDCRLVWLDTMPTRIHGCCQVTDGSLQADATPSDALDAMTENPDDRIEYNFKCDLDRSTFACTRKHFINARIPTPTVVERIYRTRDDRDELFPAHVEAASVETANGYVIEWEGDIGFSAEANHRGLCSLAFFDNDAGEDQTRAYAFGPINDIEDWACCQYAEQ